MFDHMAHYYDEMNRLISLGLDMSWRRSAVRHLTLLPPHSKILDVAMGTGDLSLALLQQRPDYHIVGIDPSVEMLRRAEKKLSRYASSVTFQQGVAEELPFSDDTFAAVMVAFGVRNFEDRKKGIAEMSRVMSRDAKLVILELGYPDSDPHGWRRWLNRIAESFIRYGVPYLGMILTGSRDEYHYLQQSMYSFPNATTFQHFLQTECVILDWIPLILHDDSLCCEMDKPTFREHEYIENHSRHTSFESPKQRHGNFISKVLDLRKSQQRDREKEQDDNLSDNRHSEYKRHPNAHSSVGGITCHDENIIKAQRSVVFELIKQVGKNVIMGRDLLYVTFPIQCCAPESALQRFAYAASYAPSFLGKAARQTHDPLERFKWVLAFYIAGMHCTCVFMKPLNPILGETYQAQLDSETMIYVEQSSHHPPVTQVLVTGPGYRFYSWVTYSAHFRYNHIKLVHTGFRAVYFDDGTKIIWDNPYDIFNGVFWGSYHQETLGQLHFQDDKNGLYLELQLGNVTNHPSDYFQGTIFSFESTHQKKKKKDSLPVAKVKGSWLGFLEVDGECYWSLAHDEKAYPTSVDKRYLLASDSTFREDLLYLEKGDLETSQQKKIELEEQQRNERKWRTKKTRTFSFLHPFQKNG
ncbi:ubiquinone/menaquinone biosynthesis methyltransferase [Galdieria sulphuraria]|uniref:Ubiquinone/menaquinone biosynthesis methyltransferase n=1 Tax=Galdieria sulphuraria TaxID=130081 RepID=M2XAP6_GALSU|nr:ubiquinone/menaquinone biosynthesis methyltransferase [Galdieria sulphuraria]EME26957.1 ubiquinone/menaquinone biosynthesis methyltransferase [Galdieria sulphuraria]|eukprot:XP_005703477.1 ubiquinone/menaquinone biosynthesis methyltransferase [Galdieria sulphuraria]